MSDSSPRKSRGEGPSRWGRFVSWLDDTFNLIELGEIMVGVLRTFAKLFTWFRH